jgi:hypothetical protein
MEDPDLFFADDGPLVRCSKQRAARSATSASPATEIRQCACCSNSAVAPFSFDTAQMPLNILDAQFRSFAHEVVPKLVQQGIGVLA